MRPAFLALKAAGIKFASGSQLKTASGQVLRLASAASPTKGAVPGQKVIAIQRAGAGGGPQVMKLIRTSQGAVLSPSSSTGQGATQVLKVVSAAGAGQKAGGVQVRASKDLRSNYLLHVIVRFVADD